MRHFSGSLPTRTEFPLLFVSALALLTGCDPNVVIGAKWHVQAGVIGGNAGQAPMSTGGGGSGGRAPEGGDAGTAGNATLGGSAGEAGAAGADAGGAPNPPAWCVLAPWLNTPVLFTSESGNEIPAGHYRVLYISGAQVHDPKLGYEVTGQYFGTGSIQAGHHIYSGDSPETGMTSLWLSDEGLINASSVAAVETANNDHSWALDHKESGELRITLYDDDYHDNSGPGTQLCVTP